MTEPDPPSDPDVHHALNEPASDPDPTEWPDPYDRRPDPRDPESQRIEMDFGDVHTAAWPHPAGGGGGAKSTGLSTVLAAGEVEVSRARRRVRRL